MKTSRNILIAFVLNLFFSVFEFIGGLFTGSVAIISDAIHDLGDAAGIGISFFLERKSKKQPDASHSYGYGRYSVLGSVIVTLILLAGSVTVIYNAVQRILAPSAINYDGMIAFAVIGVLVNLCAAYFTREKGSLNQKAVNLHMLEDVLGWVVVLVGAVIMRFTDISIIDPIMSVLVALFILYNAVKNLAETLDVFLEKTPRGISIEEITNHVCALDGVAAVHHVHVWTMDGTANYATMHIVTDKDPHTVKHMVRDELKEHNISHATLELESPGEHCHETECHTETAASHGHHHHHHHH